MTRALDAHLSGRYQACAMNYNDYLKKLFGDRRGLDRHLTYSIQFAELAATPDEKQKKSIGIPTKIQRYIASFDNTLSDAQFNSPKILLPSPFHEETR